MNFGAAIERGKIIRVNGGLYVIQSFTREGITTPYIPALDGSLYQTGDTVYFFIFQDGHGGIIAAFE